MIVIPVATVREFVASISPTRQCSLGIPRATYAQFQTPISASDSAKCFVN